MDNILDLELENRIAEMKAERRISALVQIGMTPPAETIVTFKPLAIARRTGLRTTSGIAIAAAMVARANLASKA